MSMKYNYSVLPRHKLSALGATALSDIELLEIIIGNGCNGHSFKDIAKILNEKITNISIDNLTLGDLENIKGIGTSKASSIFALIELCKRHLTNTPSYCKAFECPQCGYLSLFTVFNKAGDCIGMICDACDYYSASLFY